MYVAWTIRAADPVDSHVQARTAPKPAAEALAAGLPPGNDCGPATQSKSLHASRDTQVHGPGDGSRAPGSGGRRKELPAVGLSGTAVPVPEPPVLASITIATKDQPVVKCGSTVVGQGGRLAGGSRAGRRGLGSLAGHGQPLFREHGLLGGRGS
jgi:hypothetical protein